MSPRISPLALTLGLVALPTGALAAPCAAPPSGQSALYAAAAALAPGQACELKPNLGKAALESAGGGIPVQWTDSGAWDPIKRRIHFIGRDAGCGNASRPYVHLQYDDDSSTWSLESIPAIGPCGHAYDANTADPVTGTFYFRAYGEGKAHAWNGSAWSATADVSGSSSSPAIGLAYFPELKLGAATTAGGLVWAQANQLYVLPRGASSWTTVALPSPIGGYHNVAEYNPALGFMVFGGGNDATDVLYRMDADGKLTQLKSTPVALWTHGSEGTYLSVDPVAGHFLVYSFGQGTDGWWEFDAQTDVWANLSGPPQLSRYSFQVPIPDYGVVVMFDEVPPGGSEPTLWVYRHQSSVLPPPPDGGTGSGGAASTDGGAGAAGSGGSAGSGAQSAGGQASGGSANGGAAGSGAAAGASDGSDDGGCSCRTPRTPVREHDWLAVSVIAGLWLRRRSRARGASAGRLGRG
ncbi:MAG: hypothetical protein R3B13_20090 [Polyangiaceae bacterium]